MLHWGKEKKVNLRNATIHTDFYYYLKCTATGRPSYAWGFGSGVTNILLIN
uniref:Uncharacterized protein n=1 Tax=Anguilla anguilla TaxID=7936 RepID=A0A0E9WW70_ANGAN